LRTATDLAAYWSAGGLRIRARDLLKPIFGRFAEGLETADVKAAEQALACLG
jgi:hypothetical protein